VKKMVILILLSTISYMFIFYLVYCIEKINDCLKAQIKLNETLKEKVLYNKREMEKIKNSIYQ